MPAKGSHLGISNNYWEDKLGIDLSSTVETLSTKEALEDTAEGEGIEDVAFTREDIIEGCRVDLNFLAAVSMPAMYRFEFPPVLLTAWQLLTEGASSPVKLFPQIALGIPRGHAKTTLIKLWILFCILYTKKRFILVICSTSANAENIIADVADMLSEQNIMAAFGDWKLGRSINRQDLKKFSFRGRDIVLAAIGAEGSIRGLNVKNARPDVMIFEDIQTKECSESTVQSLALEKWMIGTAMKAKSPYGCTFAFVGNVYPGSNSILKKLKTNPTWIKFISGAILSDGTALWPALHSLPDLIAELDNDLAMGHPEIFFSEVLNDTEAGVNNRVDLSKIKDWPWGEHELPTGKFIFIDPSTNKEKSDNCAIGYVEVYDGVPGLREVIEEDLSPGNTIRKAIVMALSKGARLIVVESNAYQYTFLYWFEEICKQLGIEGLHCVDIYSGHFSKNSRIATSLKSLMAGEIVLHGSIKPRVAFQIANWSPLKQSNVDELLDMISYLLKAVELYGVEMLCSDSMLFLEGDAISVVENNSPF